MWVDGEDKGWHPRGKTSSGDTNILSQAGEHVLVRQEGGLGTNVGDPLEELGSLSGH